jgi:hypothetical protein
MASPGAPLEVADQGGAELGVGGQSGVVGGLTHRGGEPQALLPGDRQTTVVRQHPVVAAQPVGVVARTAEHLAPPQGDVPPMLPADPTWEERAEQFVALDTVVERVDHPRDRRRAAGPLDQ